MMLHIIEAKYVCDYKIEVTFNSGESGVADLSDALRGKIFEPLKDKKFFSDFSIDNELETIVWPNGADMAPEYVYFQAFKNNVKLQPLFMRWGYV